MAADRVAKADTLDARARGVLSCVLEEYVRSAEPVASRSVASRMRVSPATARSVMHELAQLGLLDQPHTSAGRVPTPRAFRLYVDRLMHESPWPTLAQSRADSRLAETEGTDELLRQAVDVLSESTGQLGFFLAGQPERFLLRSVSFVRLSSERVMTLLVSERGVVQTRVLEERESDQRALEEISIRLTELVTGFTLVQARARLASAIERERELSDALSRKAIELGVVGLARGDEGELYVADRNYLLGQPEFRDAERLGEVLHALEEKRRMMRLLDDILRADVLQVVIGAELAEPGMAECALITAPFGAAPALGGIGVIGPVRMAYDRVIPIVRGVSEMIGSYLS